MSRSNSGKSGRRCSSHTLWRKPLLRVADPRSAAPQKNFCHLGQVPIEPFAFKAFVKGELVGDNLAVISSGHEKNLFYDSDFVCGLGRHANDADEFRFRANECIYRRGNSLNESIVPPVD